MRVSDAERDEVVELLREHRMAGRLDADEHEERVAEACAARYGRDLEHALRELPLPAPPPAAVVAGPPTFVQPRSDTGGAAVTVGVLAMLLLLTGPFGIWVSLPLAGTAWVLASRSEERRGQKLAVTATVLSSVALVLWVVWFVLGFGIFFG